MSLDKTEGGFAGILSNGGAARQGSRPLALIHFGDQVCQGGSQDQAGNPSSTLSSLGKGNEGEEFTK